MANYRGWPTNGGFDLYAIERHIRKLDEVIEERDIAKDQRDEAEQTVARLREKAKEDRTEYAVLKKKLSE